MQSVVPSGLKTKPSRLCGPRLSILLDGFLANIGLAVVAQLLMAPIPLIGYNIAVAIFDGFALFTVTFLARATGNNHAPTAYVIIAAIITLVVPLRTRETTFAPLW
jgi:hypothetical protein